MRSSLRGLKKEGRKGRTVGRGVARHKAHKGHVAYAPSTDSHCPGGKAMARIPKYRVYLSIC
jgi:hypothetical protein